MSWLSLHGAADYTSLSVRTLQRHLWDHPHRLPAHWCAGRWLIFQNDLDEWVRTYPPKPGTVDVDAIVDDVLKEWRDADRESEP